MELFTVSAIAVMGHAVSVALLFAAIRHHVNRFERRRRDRGGAYYREPPDGGLGAARPFRRGEYGMFGQKAERWLDGTIMEKE